MELHERPRRVEDVVWRRGEEGVVVLNPNDGQYFSLDDVGGRIWDLSDGSRSVSEIADLLSAEYDASAAEIGSDALELLAELGREGLVRAD
jgi:Coenzyme PQQ synthesis protein D (PqqD)